MSPAVDLKVLIAIYSPNFEPGHHPPVPHLHTFILPVSWSVPSMLHMLIYWSWYLSLSALCRVKLIDNNLLILLLQCILYFDGVQLWANNGRFSPSLAPIRHDAKNYIFLWKDSQCYFTEKKRTLFLALIILLGLSSSLGEVFGYLYTSDMRTYVTEFL